MITFFAMTAKGYHVLKNVFRHFPSGKVQQVITAIDKEIKDDYYQQIFALCQQYNIPCYDRSHAFTVASEYAFAISWRWLLNIPAKLISVHDGLLPRYRGFAPLVNALINGENEIGATAIFASNDYDAGDIIEQRVLPVKYPLKINDAIEQVSHLCAEVVIDVIKKIDQGILNARPQAPRLASYSLWRNEDDYRIQWKKSAEFISRFIDAVGYPYEGASAMINNTLVRVITTEPLEDVIIENRSPGKVIFMREHQPVVVCGQGLLLIREMQWENGSSALPLKKFRTKFK